MLAQKMMFDKEWGGLRASSILKNTLFITFAPHKSPKKAIW